MAVTSENRVIPASSDALRQFNLKYIVRMMEFGAKMGIGDKGPVLLVAGIDPAEARKAAQSLPAPAAANGKLA